MSSPVVGGGGAQVGKVVSPGAFPIVDGSPGNKGSTLPDSHSPVAEEGEAARVHPAYRPHALRPHAVLPVGASLPLRSLRGSRELAAATAFSQETQHLLQSTYSRLNKRDAPPALRMGRDKAPADVATVHHPEWAHIEHTTEVYREPAPIHYDTGREAGADANAVASDATEATEAATPVGGRALATAMEATPMGRGAASVHVAAAPESKVAHRPWGAGPGLASPPRATARTTRGPSARDRAAEARRRRQRPRPGRGSAVRGAKSVKADEAGASDPDGHAKGHQRSTRTQRAAGQTNKKRSTSRCGTRKSREGATAERKGEPGAPPRIQRMAKGTENEPMAAGKTPKGRRPHTGPVVKVSPSRGAPVVASEGKGPPRSPFLVWRDPSGKKHGNSAAKRAPARQQSTGRARRRGAPRVAEELKMSFGTNESSLELSTSGPDPRRMTNPGATEAAATDRKGNAEQPPVTPARSTTANAGDDERGGAGSSPSRAASLPSPRASAPASPSGPAEALDAGVDGSGAAAPEGGVVAVDDVSPWGTDDGDTMGDKGAASAVVRSGTPRGGHPDDDAGVPSARAVAPRPVAKPESPKQPLPSAPSAGRAIASHFDKLAQAPPPPPPAAAAAAELSTTPPPLPASEMPHPRASSASLASGSPRYFSEVVVTRPSTLPEWDTDSVSSLSPRVGDARTDDVPRIAGSFAIPAVPRQRSSDGGILTKLLGTGFKPTGKGDATVKASVARVDASVGEDEPLQVDDGTQTRNVEEVEVQTEFAGLEGGEPGVEHSDADGDVTDDANDSDGEAAGEPKADDSSRSPRKRRTWSMHRRVKLSAQMSPKRVASPVRRRSEAKDSGSPGDVDAETGAHTVDAAVDVAASRSDSSSLSDAEDAKPYSPDASPVSSARSPVAQSSVDRYVLSSPTREPSRFDLLASINSMLDAVRSLDVPSPLPKGAVDAFSALHEAAESAEKYVKDTGAGSRAVAFATNEDLSEREDGDAADLSYLREDVSPQERSAMYQRVHELVYAGHDASEFSSSREESNNDSAAAAAGTEKEAARSGDDEWSSILVSLRELDGSGDSGGGNAGADVPRGGFRVSDVLSFRDRVKASHDEGDSKQRVDRGDDDDADEPPPSAKRAHTGKSPARSVDTRHSLLPRGPKHVSFRETLESPIPSRSKFLHDEGKGDAADGTGSEDAPSRPAHEKDAAGDDGEDDDGDNDDDGVQQTDGDASERAAVEETPDEVSTLERIGRLVAGGAADADLQRYKGSGSVGEGMVARAIALAARTAAANDGREKALTMTASGASNDDGDAATTTATPAASHTGASHAPPANGAAGSDAGAEQTRRTVASTSSAGAAPPPVSPAQVPEQSPMRSAMAAADEAVERTASAMTPNQVVYGDDGSSKSRIEALVRGDARVQAEREADIVSAASMTLKGENWTPLGKPVEPTPADDASFQAVNRLVYGAHANQPNVDEMAAQALRSLRSPESAHKPLRDEAAEAAAERTQRASSLVGDERTGGLPKYVATDKLIPGFQVSPAAESSPPRKPTTQTSVSVGRSTAEWTAADGKDRKVGVTTRAVSTTRSPAGTTFAVATSHDLRRVTEKSASDHAGMPSLGISPVMQHPHSPDRRNATVESADISNASSGTAASDVRSPLEFHGLNGSGGSEEWVSLTSLLELERTIEENHRKLHDAGVV